MSKPIEILGNTFNSEEEARRFYTDDLRKRLPGLKQIEGFPIGDDEDILALSNPPFYTACPNPYINEFIEKYGKPYNEETDDYHREPFINDVSYGKNDPLLNAHFYHTKVPPKAIEDYISHYTDENDIVLDGFCGTGTTGIAANRTNRKAILTDISPIACFIAHNQTSKLNSYVLLENASSILARVKNDFGWLYGTNNAHGKSAQINYTIWSDVFKCSFCSKEYIYSDLAVDFNNNKLNDNYVCQSCGATISKDNSTKVFKAVFDDSVQKEVEIPKQVPVLMSYIQGKKKSLKQIDSNDFALIEKIENHKASQWFPTSPIMFKGDEFGDLWRAGYHKGYYYSHNFYTKRNLLVLSALYNEIEKIEDRNIKNALKFVFTSVYSRDDEKSKSKLISKACSHKEILGSYFFGLTPLFALC